MEIETRGKWKFAKFQSLQDYQSTALENDIDWVEIVSESPLGVGFWGSRYVTWRRNLQEDFYSEIGPTSAKHIKKAINKAQRLGYHAEHYLETPPEIYHQWWQNLYAPYMKYKGTQPYIDLNWLNTESGKRHHSIMIFNEANELVAGSFYWVKKNGTHDFSFKAVNHELSVDINSLLEKTAFDIAQTNGGTFLGKGIDYNLYGFGLNLGLINYKQKFGFKAHTYIVHSYYRELILLNHTMPAATFVAQPGSDEVKLIQI